MEAYKVIQTLHLETVKQTFFFSGQSQLIGSSQPIMAALGDDITLPCRLDPAEDAAGMTLEWTRPDLNPRFVYVWRSGQELEDKKHKSFEGRTSLFMNELKNGNISLKLSNVKVSDHGTYRCFLPALEKQIFVQLVIGKCIINMYIHGALVLMLAERGIITL